MHIEIMSPDELRPYDKNPRINENSIDAVMKSIDVLGFNQPIVCNQDNIICAGHVRWQAALRKGLKTVPVYKKTMSEKEFIAYNIADNKTAEGSTWDDKLLTELLRELEELDDNFLAIVGYTDQELSDLLEIDKVEFDDGLSDEIDHPTKKEKIKKEKNGRLTFSMNREQFDDVTAMLEILSTEIGLDSNTDLLIYLLEFYKQNK